MITKPKMLQITSVDSTIFHLLFPLLKALRDDFEVHVACAEGQYTELIKKEGFKVFPVDFSRSLTPKYITKPFFELRKIIKKERYDIIHTHTPIAGIIGRFSAWTCGVPRIVNTVHGFYFHENMMPLKRNLAQIAEWLAGQVTTHSFFQSQEDYEQAIKLHICKSGNGTWISNGVDQIRFEPKSKDLCNKAGILRGKLGLNSQDIVICTVARMVREKGILELLEAFTIVAGQVKNVHLVLVGDAFDGDRDGIVQEIQEVVRNSPFGERIHLLGKRNDIETILRASDIFVLPSYREGMPRSIIEAMSMGLPVVATNIRGCREEVLQEETGLLVPVGKVEPLAKTLLVLINDPYKRGRFGINGLARAKSLFDENKVIEKQIGIFKQLLRARCDQYEKASI
jgi:glycosyltransferase involved in cell wall biosynthesis